MIQWLSWLPDKSSFNNSNILEILKDSANIPLSLTFLEQRVHELVKGPLPLSLLENVVGNKSKA